MKKGIFGCIQITTLDNSTLLGVFFDHNIVYVMDETYPDQCEIVQWKVVCGVWYN